MRIGTAVAIVGKGAAIAKHVTVASRVVVDHVAVVVAVQATLLASVDVDELATRAAFVLVALVAVFEVPRVVRVVLVAVVVAILVIIVVVVVVVVVLRLSYGDQHARC